MTKKTQTILSLICLFLLFLTAPISIFYSQGYRFDFEAKKIVQTGGFYAKTLPKSAEIHINEKLREKTDFLFGTALIKNLLPKTYEIEIKKQGYHPWKKSLEIKEKQVTEAKNIVLIPENPDFVLLDKNIKNFWFSPNSQKIILKKENEKGWILDILDIKQDTQTPLLSEEKVGQTNILDLVWSSDSNKILLKTLNSFFVLELDNPSIIFPLDFLGKNIEKISFDPSNTKKIFFFMPSTTANSLFLMNYREKKIPEPILNNVITYENFGKDIIWLSSEGFVYRSNSNGKILQVFNSKPLKTPESIKNFIFSPDNKKIAYSSDFEIWIFFLEQQDCQPQKAMGEKVFLTRFSKKIDNCFWLTSHYLIFNVDNKIKIAEIDDRDRINIIELCEFKNPQLFFNQNDKKLYILSEGNLYQSKKLY